MDPSKCDQGPAQETTPLSDFSQSPIGIRRSPTARRSRAVGVALLFCALSVSCDRRSEEQPSKVKETGGLAREIEELSTNLQHLLLRPWKSRVPGIATHFASMHSEIVALSTDAMAARQDESAAVPFRARAQAFLSAHGEGKRSAIRALMEVAPIFDEAFAIETEIRNHLKLRSVPDTQPFALRSLFQEGWQPSLNTASKLINDGLTDLVTGKTADRMMIGKGNLALAVTRGRELQAKVMELNGALETLESKLKTLRGLHPAGSPESETSTVKELEVEVQALILEIVTTTVDDPRAKTAAAVRRLDELLTTTSK